MESCIALIVGGVDRQAIGLHPTLTAGHPSVTKHTAPSATPRAVCFRKAAQSQLKYTYSHVRLVFGKIIYVQKSSQHGVSKQARGKHSASLSQNAQRHFRTYTHTYDTYLNSKLKQKNRLALDSNFYPLQKE